MNRLFITMLTLVSQIIRMIARKPAHQVLPSTLVQACLKYLREPESMSADTLCMPAMTVIAALMIIPARTHSQTVVRQTRGIGDMKQELSEGNVVYPSAFRSNDIALIAAALPDEHIPKRELALLLTTIALIRKEKGSFDVQKLPWVLALLRHHWSPENMMPLKLL